MESMMSMNPMPKTDDHYIGIKPLPPRRKEVEERILGVEEAITTAARMAAEHIAKSPLPPTNGSGELATRLEDTGYLASEAVRTAYKQTAEQVEKALEEVKTLVQEIEKEANEFINTLQDTGAYHADRIDTATQNLKSLLQWMSNQRHLISKEILPLPPPTVADAKKSADDSY